MTPSENMNAAQIAGYLERLIEHDLKGLMDTAQDVEKALADLLLSDPQRYAELTSGNGSLAQLDSLTANLRAMMDDLSYDHDELVAQSDYIYTNRNAPFNAEYSEKERIQYGRSIREASENHPRHHSRRGAALPVLGTEPCQMVQRGVLDGPLFDQSGAMSSILSLGGLGFTLPSSLPSFLAGSSIGFDLPSRTFPKSASIWTAAPILPWASP